MKPRRIRVRSTIAVLLVCLIALWSFAVYVMVAPGLHLLSGRVVEHAIGGPTDQLVTAMQSERLVAAESLAGSQVDPGSLALLWATTDRVHLDLVTAADGRTVRWATPPRLADAVHTVVGDSAALSALRQLVSQGRADDRFRVESGYSALVADVLAVRDQLAPDTGDGRTATELYRARELLAQEDAVVSGIVVAGSLTTDDVVGLARLVGARRTGYADALDRLTAADRAGFDQVGTGAAYADLTRLEAAVTEGGPVPFTATQWRQAVEPVLAELQSAGADLDDALARRARPQTIATVAELVLVLILGLVAIIATVRVLITVARRLRALRAAADEVATQRLPGVVERLGRGEPVDISAEAPLLHTGPDELGQVGLAFNRMRETAVRVATEQAELRRGVRDVFLSLARRSQALLHRQLGLLDAMERRATTPEALAELFRVDHLATRMRRNAENLIVLSGATAGRTWRKSVPLVDVMRAALAEVEDYSRVSVLPPAPAALIGPAVGDVIHLLAELVENAVSFSPPQTVVRVGGAPVGETFVIEVEDRGLGMTDTQRAAANEQLRHPPEFTLAGTARLGLYVVSRLAQRHGVTVELRESPYGGTTAVVTLPADLITHTTPALPANRRDPEPGRGLEQLASIGAGPLRSGPARSDPVAVAASGLPVRQRPSSPDDAAAAPADDRTASGLPRRTLGDGRGTPTPLPGLDHLDAPTRPSVPDARR